MLAFYVPVILALVGLGYMFYLRSWVNKQDAGTDKMKSLANYINEGALAFLNAEYRILAVFVVIAAIVLGVVSVVVDSTPWFIVIAFVLGAIFSAFAGNIGMRIATQANVRTTQAARTSLSKALEVAFKGGTVMGLGVAGLAVLGLTLLFIVLIKMYITGDATTFYPEMTKVLEALAGFSLGAESIALFARVGGGIYTKAADVGADLVGKVEAGIPEDDPRNPATIADNVGDNVGDVAGMGADLFGSYVATILATMVLGNYIINDTVLKTGVAFTDGFMNMGPILLPIIIAGAGIIFSILGTFVVRANDDAKEPEVQSAFNKGNWGSIALTGIACFFLIQYMMPEVIWMDFFGEGYKAVTRIDLFIAVCIGLFVGAAISAMTEYYTGLGKPPILEIVNKSSTGAATNIIAGLATGMFSTAGPILLFAGAIWASYAFAGFYGIAIAASAMMATTAMQLAIDAFGPIADNAGGIAEMSELPDDVREKTDILDSVGNTTAATGKGFAIASAALTALALFAAYVTFTGINGINIFKAPVLAALFVGGMIPVVFSAFAMNSVGKAAMEMVKEVRRQFKEIPGIMEGTGTPEYGKCVDISTKAALREMMYPGAMTILTPIAVIILAILFTGFDYSLSAEILGGYMAGVTVSGVLWAIFQNNAGGAWDNAKKSFEAGVMIDGVMTYKGSEAHKAAVTGDTVGDPFKDTSGPSMNILIKLTCLVGLVIAPILGEHIMEQEAQASTVTTQNVSIDNKSEVSNSVSTGTTVEVKDAAGNKMELAVTGEVGAQKVNYIKGTTGVVTTETMKELKSRGYEISGLLNGNSGTANIDVNKEVKYEVTPISKFISTYAKSDSKEASKSFELKGIFFKEGSASVVSESKIQLKEIVNATFQFPNLKYTISYSISDQKTVQANKDMSLARAQAIVDVLKEMGVKATFEAVGNANKRANGEVVSTSGLAEFIIES